jgi:serine/threonine-protein kinase
VKVGQLVADRFELEALAGVGGMSSVFRARDTLLERRVALKVLHEHHADDPEYVERFRREARAIAKLSHPNIVTVIDRGVWEGCEYIVFEHVEGPNLKELVEEHGPLSPLEALTLAHQAARGLAFAHEHGIVHRDVKPHNVLVDADGTAKVTDFGIARSLDADAGLTETGTVLGTSDYVAPEQVEGGGVDARSDQYSFGVLLYELLVGEPPFAGESFVAVAMRHLHDPVPSVRERRPEVSERVEELVRRALAKRPEDRFPTTDALLAALEACLAEEREPQEVGGGLTIALPAAAVAAPPRQGPSRRRYRRGTSLVLAGTALVVAALVGAVLATRGGDGMPGLPGDPLGDEGGEAGRDVVTLTAVRDFDPDGDGTEHPEAVARATDGDRATYWTTETYRSFQKPGVGLVLDAGEPVELGELTVVSDTPGFTALVRAGASPGGDFREVSQPRAAAGRTAFQLDTGGEPYRYYLLWITDPNSRAHVNEVRGR